MKSAFAGDLCHRRGPQGAQIGDHALILQGARIGADLGGAAEAVFGTLGWQGDDQARWLDQLIEPLARQQRAKSAARAAQTATTQVEFFTLVRGED